MIREWMSSSTREEKIFFAGGWISLKEIEEYPDSKAKHTILSKLEIVKQNHNPNENYGENGSRFSNEFLDEIGGMIILYPLEWMADFIQNDHKKLVDENDNGILSGMEHCIKSTDLYYLFQHISPYYLGLSAYIILNTKDEKIFNSALEFLDLYQKYYIACLSNDKDELNRQVEEHEKWLESITEN